MALDRYKAKRDFQKTPEPGPQNGKKAKGQGKAPIFVVQEHHASRLHYDFRLEADGVLKSWAVPKGPSMDPSEKRLAVQVEDHPLDYATFKGRIPEGQYGAGIVKIWDHGTYDNLMAQKAEPLTMAEAIEAGHVEVELHGRKLHGRFALVRMQAPSKGKVNWLLIKMKDEHADAEAESEAKAPKPKAKARKPAGPKRKASAKAPRAFTEFTHTDKIMFPEAGITKGDVIDFYDRIADRLLPYLHDRPATLERLPDGLSGPDAPHFWQKDLPDSAPDWLPRVALETEKGKVVHYPLVNDKASLLYLVNRPDFVLFDLDPGQASFANVVAVARHLHDRLEADGHEVVVKTSGKSGLHVLVPWTQEGGYDESRAWARDLAVQAVDELADQATVEIRKAGRGERVYIDVMQNVRGHHAVPPYVLRATPQATVSTPLTWRELKPDLDPAAFTLKTIFRRLARQKHDPLGTHLLPTV
jgi:bifunctional non-homologous end joining protein LigD